MTRLGALNIQNCATSTDLQAVHAVEIKPSKLYGKTLHIVVGRTKGKDTGVDEVLFFKSGQRSKATQAAALVRAQLFSKYNRIPYGDVGIILSKYPEPSFLRTKPAGVSMDRIYIVHGKTRRTNLFAMFVADKSSALEYHKRLFCALRVARTAKDLKVPFYDLWTVEEGAGPPSRKVVGIRNVAIDQSLYKSYDEAMLMVERKIPARVRESTSMERADAPVCEPEPPRGPPTVNMDRFARMMDDD